MSANFCDNPLFDIGHLKAIVFRYVIQAIRWTSHRFRRVNQTTDQWAVDELKWASTVTEARAPTNRATAKRIVGASAIGALVRRARMTRKKPEPSGRSFRNGLTKTTLEASEE